ncbi:MAG: hypothetical protein RIM83_07140 [Allomuricauda sp.]
MTNSINFNQGTSSLLEGITEDEKKIEFIESRVSEFFNMKNIYFLFGSGTSNGAIPTMKGMFAKVKTNVSRLDEKQVDLFKNIKLKGEDDFEELLGILYSQKIFLENLSKPKDEELKDCKKLILEIEKTIFNEINVDICKLPLKPNCLKVE